MGNTRNVTNDIWEPIIKIRGGAIRDDGIARRITQLKSGNYGVYIGIGRDIASILGWAAKDRVNVFTNRMQSTQILLKKSNDSHGYVLQGSSTVCLSFKFVVRKDFNLPLNKTEMVAFDIRDDKSLLIDIALTSMAGKLK